MSADTIIYHIIKPDKILLSYNKTVLQIVFLNIYYQGHG